MKRLVTFGCSLTQGQDLEEGVEYSRLAWPFLLGQKLNLAVTNCGKNGSSVKRIWWDIMNFDFHSNDVVVILWTHINRWCIIKGDDPFDRKGPLPANDWDLPREGFSYPASSKVDNINYDYLFNNTESHVTQPHPDQVHITDVHHSMFNKQSEMWYKYFHDEYDMLQQTFLHINHADMYLKNKVNNVFHLRASEPNLTTDFNQVDFLKTDIDKLRQEYPTATDGWHPGIEFQEEYASRIKKEIEKQL